MAMNNVLTSIGNTISRARREKRLSQYQLATIAGVSSSDVSAVESGDFDPLGPSVEHILCAVGLPLRVLDAVNAPKAKPTTEQILAAKGISESPKVVNLEAFRRKKWQLNTTIQTD
jgi:transcriptional regulator with XRE-family HTH domain